MVNPTLDKKQLVKANDVLALVRRKLKSMSRGDKGLLFAYTRKISKGLMHDERSTPAKRNKLKRLKWEQQKHKCAICRKSIKRAYSELDRFYAPDGYTESNTRLVHHACHVKQQRGKNYH